MKSYLNCCVRTSNYPKNPCANLLIFIKRQLSQAFRRGFKIVRFWIIVNCVFNIYTQWNLTRCWIYGIEGAPIGGRLIICTIEPSSSRCRDSLIIREMCTRPRTWSECQPFGEVILPFLRRDYRQAMILNRLSLLVLKRVRMRHTLTRRYYFPGDSGLPASSRRISMGCFVAFQNRRKKIFFGCTRGLRSSSRGTLICMSMIVYEVWAV